MLSIAARLTLLVTQLRTAIGAFVVRESRVQRVVWLGTQAYSPKIPPNARPKLPFPVWGLFVDRLARLATRFETLFQRWRTATLAKPRPPRANRAAQTTTPKAAPPRLPGAHGWAHRRIPEAAPPTGQLDELLRDPETRAFVAAAPQAGRLLRPLCRALGLPAPDWLRLPRRRPAARPPAPRASPRPASLRAIQQSDRPLQPYVLAATRAWKPKFG